MLKQLYHLSYRLKPIPLPKRTVTIPTTEEQITLTNFIFKQHNEKVIDDTTIISGMEKEMNSLELIEYSKQFKFENISKPKSTHDYNLILAHLIQDISNSWKYQQLLRTECLFPTYLDSITIPNQITFELCIRHAFGLQDVQMAQVNIKKMIENQMHVNDEFLLHLLDGFCLIHDTENAIKLTQELLSKSIVPSQDIIVYLLFLMFAYGKELKSIELFIKLGNYRISNQVNMLMKQLLFEGYSKLALKMYLWMFDFDLKPSRIAYESLQTTLPNVIIPPPPTN